MKTTQAQGLGKIKLLYDRLIDWTAVVIVTVITIVTFYQVFSRFLLHHTPAWTEEMARFLLIWLVFVGSAIAYRKGAHLAIDFFISILRPNIARICTVFVHLISLSLIVALAIAGIKMFPVGWAKFSPGMKLPMFYPYLAVFTGSLLLFVENVTHLFTTIFMFRER